MLGTLNKTIHSDVFGKVVTQINRPSASGKPIFQPCEGQCCCHKKL
jgi:hypothetical protein